MIQLFFWFENKIDPICDPTKPIINSTKSYSDIIAFFFQYETIPCENSSIAFNVDKPLLFSTSSLTSTLYF